MGTLCTFVEGMHFQLLVKDVWEWGLGEGGAACHKVFHLKYTLLRLLRAHRQQHSSETFKEEQKTLSIFTLQDLWQTQLSHGAREAAFNTHNRLLSVVWQSLLKAVRILVISFRLGT